MVYFKHFLFRFVLKNIFPLTILLTVALVNQVHGQVNLDVFKNTWYGFNTGNFDNGRYPTSIKTADLDNDGDIDVAVAEAPFGNGFAVLLNNGNGFYGSPSHYVSPKPTRDIFLADFNNDNFTDVAVSNTGSNSEGSSISIFLNNSSGSFGSPVNYNVGTGPVGLTSADFDQDGDNDIAAANYGFNGQGNTISILLNNGNGTFSNQLIFPAGTGPYKIASALINNDNLPDIVVADADQRMNVLINTGGNDFSNKTEYNVFSQFAGDFFQSISLADVDNDGDIDALYSSTSSEANFNSAIALFRNTGTGTFGSPESIVLSSFTGGSVDIEVADLNGDGWNDIVGDSYNGRNTDGFQVLLNNGSGGFLSASLYPAGQGTFNIALADADNDGKTDVLTADNYSMEITIRHNSGNGIFFNPPQYLTNPIAGSLDAADIDLDGDLDVVTSAWGRAATGSQVAVLKNNGDGSFGSAVTYIERSGGVQAKFRDLNNDGYPDLIFATSISSPPYDFHTALNNGDGTFGTIQTWPVGACGWSDIDAFDLDNDGDLDAVITEWLGCVGVPESAKRLFVSKNNGDGTFAPATYMIIDPFPSTIAGADLNGDDIIDLVTGHANSVDVLIGIGNGQFQTQVAYATELNPQDIVIDDFNNDGIKDLAVSTFSSVSGMSVLLGNGDGTFQTTQNYDGAYSPDLLNVAGIASGDLDGDGFKDIMVANEASNDLSIYYNNGDGTFTYRMRAGIYWGATSPFFADFTGDGINDLAALITLPPSGLTSAVTVIEGKYSVVPVELVSFSAIVDGNNVSLSWSAATEINNKGFYIERKSDDNWTEIGFVEGSGTTTEIHNYSYEDKNVDIKSSPEIYYRLKQTDFDGSFNYSKQVELNLSPSGYSLSQNYPNPFNPSTKIQYSIPQSSNVTIKVFDILGNEIKTLVNEEKPIGTYKITWYAENLPSGIYLYKLQAGNFIETKKMILLK